MIMTIYPLLAWFGAGIIGFTSVLLAFMAGVFAKDDPDLAIWTSVLAIPAGVLFVFAVRALP